MTEVSHMSIKYAHRVLTLLSSPLFFSPPVLLHFSLSLLYFLLSYLFCLLYIYVLSVSRHCLFWPFQCTLLYTCCNKFSNCIIILPLFGNLRYVYFFSSQYIYMLQKLCMSLFWGIHILQAVLLSRSLHFHRFIFNKKLLKVYQIFMNTLYFVILN